MVAVAAVVARRSSRADIAIWPARFASAGCEEQAVPKLIVAVFAVLTGGPGAAQGTRLPMRLGGRRRWRRRRRRSRFQLVEEGRPFVSELVAIVALVNTVMNRNRSAQSAVKTIIQTVPGQTEGVLAIALAQFSDCSIAACRKFEGVEVSRAFSYWAGAHATAAADDRFAQLAALLSCLFSVGREVHDAAVIADGAFGVAVAAAELPFGGIRTGRRGEERGAGEEKVESGRELHDMFAESWFDVDVLRCELRRTVGGM